MPEKAILHKQKAQVLLELGEAWNAWNALKAATRASTFPPLHVYIFPLLFSSEKLLNSLFLVKSPKQGATLKRATELDPGWAEAWITVGRSQLNFGEPDFAIESSNKALAIKPDSVEAKENRQAASHPMKRRKQLQSTGLSSIENHFLLGDQG